MESVVVCSTGNRNAFPLRAIGRDDTPQQWPTLLIHRASFSRGSFIINSTCYCLFDIRANSRKRKKIDALPSTRRHARMRMYRRARGKFTVGIGRYLLVVLDQRNHQSVSITVRHDGVARVSRLPVFEVWSVPS